MARVLTKTFTGTFTKLRIAVIEDQFDLMLRYASLSKSRREQILDYISQKKIEGIGLYIEDDGWMLMELSLIVDWEKHSRLIEVSGSIFNTELPGWEDGVCPEVSVAANRIANEAKELEKHLRVWIMFTDDVRKNTDEHKALCEKLGFKYGGSVPKWKNGYGTKEDQSPDLRELSIILRGAE